MTRNFKSDARIPTTKRTSTSRPSKKAAPRPNRWMWPVNFGPFPANHPPTVSISPATIRSAQTSCKRSRPRPLIRMVTRWLTIGSSMTTEIRWDGLRRTQPDSASCTRRVHSWTQQGIGYVRCTVTDMKGGSRTASATVTVTNGLACPAHDYRHCDR